MSHRIPGFTFTGMYIYECVGISHTIAEYRHDETGIEFNLIPGGSFLMGGTAWTWELPVHQVTLQPFLMGKYECTQAQYKMIMGVNRSFYTGNNRPVERVTWHDSDNCCSRVGLELPTEAQWEYACRGSSITRYYFGDDNAESIAYAWDRLNAENTTQPVGGRRPNAFGLYDMHGNVLEWCRDYWYNTHTGAPTDGSARNYDPEGRGRRVLRGGSFMARLSGIIGRSGSRRWGIATRCQRNLGFRFSYSDF